MSFDSLSSTPTAQPQPRGRFATAAITIGGFTALLWVLELVDTIVGHRLDGFGIRPWNFQGLSGILFAPLLHAGWGHLIANTGPVLVLGFIILLSGLSTWIRATAVIWVVAGLGTWLTGFPNSVHIGASSLVFGWILFLIARGFYARSIWQILLGVVIFLAYGGVLWGVFPGTFGVSWQGHLFGAVGGFLAAMMLGREAKKDQ